MNFLNKKKKYFITLVMFSLVFSFVFSPLFSKPKKTEAVTGALGCSLSAIVGGAAGAAKGALMNVPVFDDPNYSQNSMHTGKECLLDGMVALAKEMLITSITKSIVNWINSGFQGSPAFVTDFGGEMEKIADTVAGEFISESNLDFLCDPISINLGLNKSYYGSGGSGSSFEDQYTCTLNDVIDNVDNFVKNNDFSEGGFSGFLELGATKNNPYSQLIGAQTELGAKINSAQEEKKEVLAWGQGFLSKRPCLKYEYHPDGSSYCVKYGPIETPGQVINAQLNDTLGTGLAQLEVADEIDEIISALLGQLAKQAMKGLASLTTSEESKKDWDNDPNTPNATYFGGIGSKQNQTEEEFNQKVKEESITQMENMIANEKEYKNIKEDSLGYVIAAKSDWDNVYNSFKGSGCSIASARMKYATSTVQTDIIPLKNQLEEDIASSIQNVIDLETVYKKQQTKIKNIKSLNELQTFLKNKNIDISKYNVEYSDIQNAELKKMQIKEDMKDLRGIGTRWDPAPTPNAKSELAKYKSCIKQFYR